MHRALLIAGVLTPNNQDAGGMFSSMAVSSNGWQLTGTIRNAKDGGTYAGLNDSASPGLALTVSSRSWTTGGVETTISRTVYATSVIRQPYNNGTLLQETENGANCEVVWSLSSRIFDDDTITACSIASGFFTDNGTGGSSATNGAETPSVTNNSTLAYYQPQAVWLTPPLERITSSSWAPRLFVGHRYGQQGQPVRAVKFTATDTHSNTVTSTVSALTTGQYSASTLYANWFQPSWNLSTLTDGDTVTVDATIYPWVGDAYVISASADAYPSPNLCVLKAICDVGGTYGTVYAYVDGTGAGSPAASTNAATAAANPFASISAAAAAGVTLNNSTYSRNSLSGVTVRIAAATSLSGLGADTMDGLAEGALPLLIEGINQSTSKLTTSGTADDIPGLMKLKNLTLERQSGADNVGFDGKNSVNNALVFEDVIFSAGTATNPVYTGWLYQTGRQYYVNCSGPYAGQGANFGGETMGCAMQVGCNFRAGQPYNAVACSGTTVLATLHSFLGTPKGPVFAFNAFRSDVVDKQIHDLRAIDFGTRGWFVGFSTMEPFGAQNTDNCALSGDNDTTALVNGNCIGNTMPGDRLNIAYQDTGSAAVNKDIVVIHNVLTRLNMKSDYFPTANAARTGNWAIRHGVDCSFNFVDLGGSDNQTVPRYDYWVGEGLGDSKSEFPRGYVVTGNPDFVNDQSSLGGDAGSGDYSPGASTDIPLIPAGETMYAVDLYGTAIPTNGTAYAGAVQ